MCLFAAEAKQRGAPAAAVVSSHTNPPLCLHTGPLKTRFIGPYKEVFRSAHTPSVTEPYYLYSSLRLPRHVCLLTTSCAGRQTCCYSTAADGNKEPFERARVKRCWLTCSAGEREATPGRRKSLHFILLRTALSSSDPRRRFQASYRGLHACHEL